MKSDASAFPPLARPLSLVSQDVNAQLHFPFVDRSDIPDTPAGRQVLWYLDAAMGLEEVSLAVMEAHYSRIWPGSPFLKSDELGRKAFRSDWDSFGELVIENIEFRSPHEVAITLAPPERPRQTITLSVEEKPPHRIMNERWERVFEFDLRIREATDADARILAEIERGSPVVMGETRVATDRGEDYFGAARLIEDVTVFIAEIEGEPAGVAWGARGRGQFAGSEKRLCYFFHLRILPQHQRKGLWGAFDNAVWDKYGSQTDLYVGYYMIENVAWAHVAEEVRKRPDYVEREWVPTVYRLLLPTASLAAPPAGRKATPDDAKRIVEILNDFHAGEEFYFPYTERSLVSRLERDPLYAWDRVLLGDGAVIGTWPAGEKIEVVIERDGTVTRTRRGHVMDYGFLPGAEAEFSALLGTSCAELDARGIPQISIFTSKGSKGQPILKELEGAIEFYRFNTGTSATIPDSAEQTGIYTDHLYF